MRIPGYRALRELRTGHLGTLYTARKWTGRRVYIRVLHDNRYGVPFRMEEARKRLRRIRGVAAPIEHGALEDGRRYIVSAGEPVERWPDYGEIPWKVVIAALAVAHERGVVHGNLSEESIVIDDGGVIVTDFGLAPVIDERRAEQYAPERRWAAVGERGPQLLPQTDQYELGLMMLRRPDASVMASTAERATRENPESRFASTWEMLPGPPEAYSRVLTYWTPFQLAAQFVSTYTTTTPGP